MTDRLRIAHLRIAPQWAILRWAILTFTNFFAKCRLWVYNGDFLWALEPISNLVKKSIKRVTVCKE